MGCGLCKPPQVLYLTLYKPQNAVRLGAWLVLPSAALASTLILKDLMKSAAANTGKQFCRVKGVLTFLGPYEGLYGIASVIQRSNCYVEFFLKSIIPNQPLKVTKLMPDVQGN